MGTSKTTLNSLTECLITRDTIISFREILKTNSHDLLQPSFITLIIPPLVIPTYVYTWIVPPPSAVVPIGEGEVLPQDDHR